MRAPKSAVADLGTQLCRSRVNPRSVPSSSFGTRVRACQFADLFGTRAPQDEDEHHGSRPQTTRTPSFPRRMFAPGVCILASLTRIEGWAERQETFGCVRGTRWAYHDAIRQALARRLASLGVGRSPLGAPPWRFFTRGRASVSGMT